MKITKIHPKTGEENTLDLDITKDQMRRWFQGEHIQVVMPELTADEREFMISGLLPGQYDEMFKHDEEE